MMTKEKLNIIVLARWFVRWNGMSQVVYNLSKELIENGHNVLVITYKGYADREWVQEIPTMRINRSYHNLLSLKDIAELLREYDADVVHSHGLLGLAAYLSKKNYIVTYHGNWPMNMFASTSSFLFSFTLLPLSVIEMKKAWKVICVSRFMKKVLKNAFDIDSVFIPNGVNEEIIIDNLDPHKRDDLIVFLGTLSRRKAKYLIDVIHAINSSSSKRVSVLIAGKIVDKSLYRSLIKIPNVNVLGYVSEKEKLEILRRSKVVILPSMAENIPVVVLEAFSQGVPVIAFKVGGLPDVIINGYNGFLIDRWDVHLFARKTLKIIDDLATYMQLARNAVSFAKRNTWKKIAEKYQKIYYQMLQQTNIDKTLR